MNFPHDNLGGLDDDFSGVVRLFPLPNLVLFPHVLLPLHIFEPRYVAMTQAALAGDRLIAMAQLQPDVDPLDPERPEIYPVICVGRIVHHVELEDGRFNLIVQGLQRASIIEELPLDELYREARVELLAEEPLENASVEDQRRAELLGGFRKLFPTLDAKPELHQVFESAIPLGVLCDVFAYALSLDAYAAQRLLSEFNVERRSRLLLEFMKTALAKQSANQPIESDREFPPPFSLN